VFVVFHFEFLHLPGHQLYLTTSPISLLSSAGNCYQGVQAVSVLRMTANKSIAQYPILPNTGKYWAILQCQYRSNPIYGHHRSRWRNQRPCCGGGGWFPDCDGDIIINRFIHTLQKILRSSILSDCVVCVCVSAVHVPGIQKPCILALPGRLSPRYKATKSSAWPRVWSSQALRLWKVGPHSSVIIYATADEADAYMFYRCFFSVFFSSVFFCFFRPSQKYQTTVSETTERIFMKLLPNDSGENVVSNVVPKWGLGPQIILWGLKTTHCTLGGDAWWVTEN